MNVVCCVNTDRWMYINYYWNNIYILYLQVIYLMCVQRTLFYIFRQVCITFPICGCLTWSQYVFAFHFVYLRFIFVIWMFFLFFPQDVCDYLGCWSLLWLCHMSYIHCGKKKTKSRSNKSIHNNWGFCSYEIEVVGVLGFQKERIPLMLNLLKHRRS